LAAQSLQAAFNARQDEALKPWSLHMHFLAPVRANSRIDYHVEMLKEGRSVSSRQVLIRQQGKLCGTALALFATSLPGPEHQYPRPDAPQPESIPPEERLIHPTIVPPDADFDDLGYPAESLIELHVAEPEPTSGEVTFERKAWMRVVPQLPDDPMTTASTLSYFSDITLGTTALTPHGGRSQTTDLQLGAVELALWFTGPIDVSDWVLFVQDSLFAGRGHGLAHGVFYNVDGAVSGLALQNALLRNR
jgi:acyl-CoA thioesterase-2